VRGFCVTEAFFGSLGAEVIEYMAYSFDEVETIRIYRDLESISGFE
jgi:hypothetical protein